MSVRLHLVVGTGADLLGAGVLYGGDETRKLIAHRLCSYASCSGLEVDVACASNAGIVGVAAGGSKRRHAGRNER